ncbi:HD family phosphohydrolase, partial [Parageobacillus sp. SY1]
KLYAKIYLTIISFIGMLIFLVESDFITQSLEDWVFIYMLSASILLLSYFSINLPPKDNSFSMDSAIYLAVTFLYGIDLAMNVLFISILIESLYKRKMLWWKHLFNF